MNNPIDQIDAMLALCARATPGKWIAPRPEEHIYDTGTVDALTPDGMVSREVCHVMVQTDEFDQEDDPEDRGNLEFIAASRTGWEATLRALKVAVPIIEAEIDKRKRDILSLRTMGRGTDLAESTAADLELDMERLERALAKIAKELETTQ